MHLKNDPAEVLDSEVDLVTGLGNDRQHPIPPETLRVFREDQDIPEDELNTSIDRHFVPIAEVQLPKQGKFDSWRAGLLAELRRVTFRGFPDRIPRAKLIDEKDGVVILETEPGIHSDKLRWQEPQE